MKREEYKSFFTGHYVQARELISKYISIEKLALMTDTDIEKEINKRFIAIQIGDNWLLVDREKQQEFKEMTLFIER